jgi:cystathionine beta-lyase
MWVADMDFRSPQAITRALTDKVAFADFGYEIAPESLINIVIERMERLYNWSVQPQDIIVIPGLVTGINLVCRALGQPGDGVLMQTPVYPPFLSAPQGHKLIRQDAPLTYVADGRHFHYEIDYDTFEAAITSQTKVFLLSNPHNPIGQTYTQEQLTRLAEICLRHNVVICSDEIHAELLLDNNQHIPLATLSPEIANQTVTLIAPSKTFNVAGLCCGFAIITNPEIRQRFIAASEGLTHGANSLGLAAAEAAYRNDPDTNDWLTTLLQYLTDNRDTLTEFVATQLPDLRVTQPQATYLAWLDCRAASLPDPFEFFMQKAKVGLNDGITFGPDGSGFVRLNFGTPRATLLDGLERMKKALENR